MGDVIYNANPATSADPGYGVSSRAYSLQYLKGLYAREGAWKHMLNTTSDAGFGESVNLAEFPSITAIDVTSSTGSFSYDTSSILQRSITMNKLKVVPHQVGEHLVLQSKYDVKRCSPRTLPVPWLIVLTTK